MTDLSVTAANVVPGTDARQEVGVAGETITAGQALYKSSTTGKWMKADSNSATAEARAATAIALTGSSLNQPIVVQTSGTITIGATMTAGIQYYLSDTAGGICPVADIGSGEYVDLVGLSTSTTVMTLNFKYSGVSL
ncbi:MAG: hypothetical protein KAX47_13425 [Zoogloea sp.]|jgi:hypothetical protein|nr:hypothetical protein [Zoogloea sp.]